MVKLILTCIAASIMACGTMHKKKEVKIENTDIKPDLTVVLQKEVLTPKLSINYEDSLAKIGAFINDGLPKSAKQTIDNIKKIALTDFQYGYYLAIVNLEFSILEFNDVLNNYQYEYDFLTKQQNNNELPISVFLNLYKAKVLLTVLQNTEDEDINYDNLSTEITNWTPLKLKDSIVSLVEFSIANVNKIPNTFNYTPIIANLIKSNNADILISDVVKMAAINIYTAISLPVSVSYVKPNIKLAMLDLNDFLKQSFITNDDPNLQYRILSLFKEIAPKHYYLDMQRIKYVQTTYNIDIEESNKLLKKLYTQNLNDENSGLILKEFIQSENNLVEKHAIITSYLKLHPTSFCKAILNDIIFNIEFKNFTVNVESVVEPNKKSLALITHTNVNKIIAKVYALSFENTIKFRLNKYHNVSRDDGFDVEQFYNEFFNESNFVTETTFDLPEYTDYKQHTTEVGLPALEKAGNYFVFYSLVDNNGITKQLSNSILTNFMVSPSLVTEIDGKIHIKNASTGVPIPNIEYSWEEIDINYKNNTTKLKFKTKGVTNAKGEFVFPKTNKYYNSHLLKIPELNFVDILFNYGAETYKEKEEKQTDWFLDRSIYRPGQKVYFKGIRTSKIAKQIIKNEKLKVSLLDENENIIRALNLTTNEFGSFTGDFDLPLLGKNTGNFFLQLGDGSREYFNVEEYKRPTFKATIIEPTNPYKMEDLVKVEGLVVAFAGYPLTNALVTYNVKRSIKPIYCWNLYKGGYGAIVSKTQQIIVGNTITNEKGIFNIDFKAIADDLIKKEENPYYNFNIEATVTDLNGETQLCSYNLVLAYTDKVVNLTLKPELFINTDISAKVEFTNLQNKPIKTKGELEIFKVLKSANVHNKRVWQKPDSSIITTNEYATNFAKYEPLNEIERLEKIQTISLNTDSENVLIKPILSIGFYDFVLTTMDETGKKLENRQRVFIGQNENGAFKVNEPLVVQSVSEIEPNQVLKILFSSGLSNAKVHIKIASFRGEIVNQIMDLNMESKVLQFPILEKDRGGITISSYVISNYRLYTNNKKIVVPYSNKQLQIKLTSLRSNMLPGSEQKWILNLTGPAKEQAAMEMLATMYDASLDAILPMKIWNWEKHATFYNNGFSFRNNLVTNVNATSIYEFEGLGNNRNSENKEVPLKIPNLKWPYNSNSNMYFDNTQLWQANLFIKQVNYRLRRSEMSLMDGEGNVETQAMVEPTLAKSKSKGVYGNTINENVEEGNDFKNETNSSNNNLNNNLNNLPRKNFKETAFFFPQLRPQANGDIQLEFTMPESLTEWKLRLFAHSTTLQSAYAEAIATTSKPIMLQPNLPRFLRQKDSIIISSKLVNTTDKEVKANVTCTIINEITGEVLNWITGLSNNVISVPAKSSVPVSFKLNVPIFNGIVKLTIMANGDNVSDGEEHVLPVLTNSMLLTESYPITITKKGTLTIPLASLDLLNTSKNIQKFTIETVNNPAWYAVRSLPYLMEFPYECTEQLFSRIYANSISLYLFNSNIKVKEVYANWQKQSKNNTNTFTSKLEQNQDLKSTLLEETPWLLEAKSETENMQKLGLKMDPNRMETEIKNAWLKLKEMQNYNEGWPWFKGMPADPWINSTLLIGFGKMQKLGISIKPYAEEIKNAIAFLDNYVPKVKSNLGDESYVVAYLYAKSFFPTIGLTSKNEDFLNMQKSITTNWRKLPMLSQAQLSLALRVLDPRSNVPNLILNAFTEQATQNTTMGMYWVQNKNGYNWSQSAIETHAAIIDAYAVDIKNEKLTKEMLIWLLRQKQTQNWGTTRATADACFAILSNNNLIENKQDLTVFIDETNAIKQSKEIGTGYVRENVDVSELKNKTLINVKSTTDDFTYGALYWQYFQDFDKIKSVGNDIKITKKYFKILETSTGKESIEVTPLTELKIGDLVTISLTIISNNNLEYVHVKDLRAAAMEPIDIISSYNEQNGLGYYQVTKDVATNFFISNLNKGQYQLNYTVKVQQAGYFNTGASTIQCMYAPEFTAHSSGNKIKVK